MAAGNGSDLEAPSDSAARGKIAASASQGDKQRFGHRDDKDFDNEKSELVGQLRQLETIDKRSGEPSVGTFSLRNTGT